MIIKEACEQREIAFGKPWIDDSDRRAVLDVLDGPILTHGPKGTEFEQAFSDFMRGGYALTTSSCMASLHLASMIFGFSEGDEVLVPAQTHVATVHAVELTKAKPVFVDCELKTGNIDIDQIESLITDKTKGLSLVHFAGIPVEMDRLNQIATKYNLKVIEDCALAIGARYKDKHVGLWGDVGCFSFYPAKHMTTAEGGMLVSKSESLVEEIKHFRAFSVDKSFKERTIPGIYDVTNVGLNYRMSELQAALGCTQLQKIEKILKLRKRNFKALKEMFVDLKDTHVLDSDNPNCANSHYCLILVLSGKLQAKRNQIVMDLKNNKIGCSIYYPHPVPRMTYYKNKYKNDLSKYPCATAISDHAIALPVGPHLSLQDIEYLAASVKQAIAKV